MKLIATGLLTVLLVLATGATASADSQWGGKHAHHHVAKDSQWGG